MFAADSFDNTAWTSIDKITFQNNYLSIGICNSQVFLGNFASQFHRSMCAKSAIAVRIREGNQTKTSSSAMLIELSCCWERVGNRLVSHFLPHSSLCEDSTRPRDATECVLVRFSFKCMIDVFAQPIRIWRVSDTCTYMAFVNVGVACFRVASGFCDCFDCKIGCD